MTEKEKIRQKLMEQLEKVNNRLKVLDLMDEKLLEMRSLAMKVLKEDLTDEEIEEINREVQSLEAEVSLLDREATDLIS